MLVKYGLSWPSGGTNLVPFVSDALWTTRRKRHAVAVDAARHEFVRAWLVNTNSAHGREGDAVEAAWNRWIFGPVDVRGAGFVELLEYGRVDPDRLGAIPVASAKFARGQSTFVGATAVPVGWRGEIPLDSIVEIRAAAGAHRPVRGRTAGASRGRTCTCSTRYGGRFGNAIPGGRACWT